MKKFIVPILVGISWASSAVGADESLRAEIEALKAQMAELKEAQSKVNYNALKKQLTEVKAHTGGDNIKWSVDFRTAYDYVEHKTTSGVVMLPQSDGSYKMGRADSGKSSNSLWTNKLVLNMAAQPVDNLIFRGAIGAYSTFGQNNLGTNSMFQDFDWYTNEKPNDSAIKLKEAYFLYFGDMGDLPYTVSFGRRPSTDGFMTNLREDNDNPKSPVGHNINMEFDGASFKFDFDKLTGISGLYAKICIGRGFSDTVGSYSNTFGPAYSKDDQNPNMDLIGVLAQLYDDGQYKVMANYFQGYNMMGMKMAASDTANPTGPTLTPAGFADVGDLSGASLSLQVDGIGDEISDFLDDTIFFASYAMSRTDPNNVNVLTGMGAGNGMMNGMLGSNDSETGYSYYAGVNMPAFMEDDRIGLEYNHGSEYWRSFTYGEDTLAGSKLATRGDAYEAYYNLPLVGKNLTAQLRYTYMSYDYAGSDMFFGMTGNPDGITKPMGQKSSYVENASNIRAYLRYRY